MDLEIASDRAERAVDFAAAAVLASAVGFAVWTVAGGNGPATAAGAAPAFLLAYAILRRLPPDERTFALPDFVLTEFESVPEREGDELLLDDKLGSVEPDARVVRLFDPGQAFTRKPAAAPDASEALSEALAELRRSLR